MKLTSRSSFLFGSGVAVLLITGACSDNISNCEERLSCPTGGSAGSGDGDGEGDGDTSSGGSDPTGSGGNEGDGDGDTTTDTETGGGTTGDGDGDQCLPALCPDGHCQGAECVECVHGDATKGCKDGAQPVCLEDNTCAECASNDDCTDPEASVCDPDSNQCIACTDNDGCAHLDDAKLCLPDTNTCVECTIETETDKCGAKSCDPATHSCTGTDVDSVETCEACVADSECKANHHCVPMEYKGEARGGYCLEDSGACMRPYQVITNERTTLSGVTGVKSCGIDETLTTCEAVLALKAGEECEGSDSECPEGGLCRKFDGLAGTNCTYECSGLASHCPTGLECDYGTPPPPPASGGSTGSGGGNGTGGQKYCGG